MTSDEIILGNFKGKESLPLANRGNTFVSLRASGIRIFPKWACDILDKVYEDDSTFLSEYRPV